MEKRNYIIIGNGAAGFNCANSIRKVDNDSSITMISDENVITYFRPQLSDYLNMEITDKIYVKNPNWYDENRIELIKNVSVTNIDTLNSSIVLKNEQNMSYDKLIIANGASNFIPPVVGRDKNGIFTLRNIEDSENIKRAMTNAKDVVVIGGGLLGLEAAWEIKKKGINVTVVEFSKRILPRQLDNESSMLFLDKVKESGVNIILGDNVEEIYGDENVNGVRLNSGNFLKADMILFSIGIRPNKALAEVSCIKVDKGVIVNSRMETSAKNVYACGDVAEINGNVFGNWASASEMGKIAGSNAAGDSKEFKSFISALTFDAMNMKMLSCGNIDDSLEKIEQKDEVTGAYEKIFLKDGRAVGAILLYNINKGGKFISAVKQGKTKEQLKEEGII